MPKRKVEKFMVESCENETKKKNGKRLSEWPKKGWFARTIMFLLTMTVCVSGCGGYECSPQAHELMDSIHTLLISEKL